MRVLAVLALLSLAAAALQQVDLPPAAGPAAPLKEPQEAPVDFICPMDKDIRAKEPGKCPRCGMRLIAGIADPEEFPVEIKLSPRAVRANKPVEMRFRVADPKTGATIKNFEIVHEKLFHLFLVSEDLEFFAHEHPDYSPSGEFRFRTVLPRPGPYRVVTDFLPSGATPQMNVATIIVPGAAPVKKPLRASPGPRKGANLEVELRTEPAQPLAGFKTLMFFKLKPEGGGPFQLEPYLGAWGHMLAASEDLIDLIHTHPFLADGGPQVQFNAIFPREGVYRLWVQFQSRGVVNTVAFDLPVKQLR